MIAENQLLDLLKFLFLGEGLILQHQLIALNIEMAHCQLCIALAFPAVAAPLNHETPELCDQFQ